MSCIRGEGYSLVSVGFVYTLAFALLWACLCGVYPCVIPYDNPYIYPYAYPLHDEVNDMVKRFLFSFGLVAIESMLMLRLCNTG
jgi:hypothetical protein